MSQNKVTVHVLTKVGLSRINRDLTGALKKALYGTTTRSYISSQCQKQFWKGLFQDFAEAENVEGVRALRFGSLALFETLAAKYPEYFGPVVAVEKEKKGKKGKPDEAGTLEGSEDAEEPKDGEDATRAAEIEAFVARLPETSQSNAKAFVEVLFGSLKNKQTLFLSEEEFASLEAVFVQIVKGAFEKGAFVDGKGKPNKVVKDLVKTKVLSNKWSFFLAGMGRMVTSNSEFSLDKGISVAHSLSTSGTTADDDFFTAVDDLKNDVGASMMGSAEHASDTHYQHITVDLNQFLKGAENPAEAIRLLTLWFQVIFMNPVRSDTAEVVYARVTFGKDFNAMEAFEDRRAAEQAATAKGAATILKAALEKSRVRLGQGVDSYIEYGKYSEKDEDINTVFAAIGAKLLSKLA